MSSPNTAGGESRNSAVAPTLLVTGFGPFEDHDVNPSGEIAKLVDGKTLHGVRIVAHCIPVTWRDGWEMIQQLAHEHEPQALLCLGVAPTPFVRLELLAKNVVLPYDKDAGGQTPSSCGDHFQIVADAPPAYTTTLPVVALESAFETRHDKLTREADENEGILTPIIQARRWHDAGSYLCNYIFYLAMHYLTNVPLRGFVHVPPFPNKPSNSNDVQHESARQGVKSREKQPPVSQEEILASGEFLVERLASDVTSRTE